MADFYIVPPRLIVGSFDRTNAVTSINTLKGDLTLVSDLNTGLRISVSGGNFRFSVDPGFYVAKSGDSIVGNITFNPSGSNYGLAVGSGVANPGNGITGALFYNTTDSALKVYNGNAWGDILSSGGITQVQGDLRYLKLDGTNTPTGNISMGSQFLRLANLASQVSAGLAGQVFFNQDTFEINVYTGSAWRNVGIAISSIAGVGISVNYTSFGSTVSINENYPFTWTGAQTHTQAITFAAAQTFDINKLNITGQSSGDIIYFNGSNWARLPVGSPNQGLKVLPSGTGITWGVVSSSGGAGVLNLNDLTDGYQYFTTGTSGTLFNISSVGQTHTFNIPIAGVGVTGLVSSQAQTFEGSKTFSFAIIGNLSGTATTAGFASTANYAHQAGYAITSGFATTANYAHQSGFSTTSGFATTASNLNVSNASTGTFFPVLSNTASSTSGIAASVSSLFSFNVATGSFGATSVNIFAGQSYSIDSNNVLSSSSLGTGVTNSSLTALGTIKSGIWAGTAITPFYGGTGFISYTKGDLLVGAGSTIIKHPVGSNSYVLVSDSNSASGVTWSEASAVGSSTIGNPTDGIYSDGFFTTWTSGTTVANAVDDINELLALIAPARPNYLTGTTLTAGSVPSYYTVRISAGLGTEWYQAGYGTGSSITKYYLSGTHTLNTPSTTTTFSAGSLTTSTYGTIFFKTINKNFPAGAGYGTIDLTSTYTVNTTNNNLKLTALGTYNNIWTKANAQILTYTQPGAGYEGLLIAHTENDQFTNTYEVWKDPWSSSNPSPTFSQSATASTYSQTIKSLSGIEYYTTGTGFSVFFKGAAGIFSSCYNTTQVYGISATGLVTATGTATNPLYSDELDKSDSNHVRVSLNSASASSFNKYLTVTIYKAHGTTASSNATISKAINTYSTVSTTTYEGFQDEAQRLVIGTGIAFTSNIDLANGNLQARSGTLTYPTTADYDTQWGGSHSFTGDQEFQRYFYKTSASTGTLTFTGFTASNIASYGTGSVNVLLQLEGDNKFFDLGVLQGSNSNDGSTRAAAISAKTSASSGALNWSLGVFTTGVSGAGNSGRYRAIIIFRTNTYTMTSITSS
jgi:hypothetical protein